jgi:hypothetical protein
MTATIKLVLWLGAVTLLCTGGWMAWTEAKATEQRRIDAEIAKQAQREKEASELRVVDHARLIAMTDADFAQAGQVCIDRITEEMGTGGLGWNFVDLNPREFGGVKTSSLMGLGLTALGSEVAGAALIGPQVEWVRQMLGDYSTLAQMQFVVTSRVDSFGGVKEILALYDCEFNSIDHANISESDRIILN